MNQHDALYMVARSYPGGMDALSQAMGISVNVLRHKLAPAVASHYPSFEEVSMIVELCEKAGVKDALLPLQALLARHGMAAFKGPMPDTIQDDDLSQTARRAVSQAGDTAAAVSVACLEGNITVAQADLIERGLQDALSALGEWRARANTSAQGT